MHDAFICRSFPQILFPLSLSSFLHIPANQIKMQPRLVVRRPSMRASLREVNTPGPLLTLGAASNFNLLAPETRKRGNETAG